MGTWRPGAAISLLLAASLGCVSSTDLALHSDGLERRLAEEARPATDPIGAYVGAVGQRLLNAEGLDPDAFRFYVLDALGENAIALPNGAIFVGLPLLLIVGSGDELAMILGHEIGHARARHVIGRLRREQWIKALTFLPLLPFNILTGSIYGNTALAVTFTAFSRAHEREADDLGAASVRLAGYDPACAVEAYATFGRLLAHVQRENPEIEQPTGIWSTHPGPEERYARLRSGLLEGAPASDCDLELLDVLDGTALREASGTWAKLEDDTIVLASSGLRLTPGHPQFDFEFGWLYVGAYRLDNLARLDSGETLESALDDVLARQRRDELVVIDQAPIGEHRALRAAWMEEHGDVVEAQLRLWIAIGDATYRIKASASHDAWKAAFDALREVGERIEPVPPSELPDELLATRLALWDVSPGETLKSVAESNHWPLEELALLNGVDDPEAPLQPGRRLKVIERIVPN